MVYDIYMTNSCK